MRFVLPVALAIFLAASVSTANAQPSTYLGFDSDYYPGDAQLPTLHKQFAFAGYWLTNPPLATSNPWVGKRDLLRSTGFGFLVLANGRFGKELLAAMKSGNTAAALGRTDAATAITAAHREGFPPRTIIFLDQEDGGRMLPEQSEYIFAWSEAVTAARFLPGLYASGEPVNDGKGPNGKPVTITTLQDIRQQVAARHLHPITFWPYQDACPPAPGCVVAPTHPPAPSLSGTIDAAGWQFAQSPQRTDRTRSCNATYSKGNCYAPGVPGFTLDLDSARSPDPSHGR